MWSSAVELDSQGERVVERKIEKLKNIHQKKIYVKRGSSGNGLGTSRKCNNIKNDDPTHTIATSEAAILVRGATAPSL